MNLLITGGSSDLAHAFVKRRLHLGDKITITCSTEESLQQTLKRYEAEQMKVKGFVYNFSNPEACEQDLDLMLQERLDGIIFNAFTRVTQLRKLHALSYSSIRQYLDININGNIWLVHKLLPAFLNQGFGRLVFISSLATIVGTSRYPAYCAAKAALEGLFINLATDYSANNILSNIVRVGLIKTARTEHFWKNPDYQNKVNQLIPQGTMGEPNQVAEALDPLLSPTSYLSGSIMTVSGGLPLMGSTGLLS